MIHRCNRRCCNRACASLLAPLSMLCSQLIITGMVILTKPTYQGAFVYSFLTYRSLLAALCVAPLALLFEREMVIKLNWRAAWWIFVNAVTGITIRIGFYYYGLRDTTATFSSCFYNLIPIITFLLSLLIRAETLRLGTVAGKVKVVGALLCVGGAMIITLYKGKILHSGVASEHVLEEATAHHHWRRGAFFLIGSCLSGAFWYLGQIKLFAVFPSKFWATTLSCAVGSLQSAIVGVLLNQQKSAWKLGWNLQLLTIICSGVLSTAVLFCVTTWVTTVKGPTYPAMFESLSLILVPIIETSIMGQDFYVGSLLGIVLIIGGLFAFLWGKGRESSDSNEEEQ